MKKINILCAILFFGIFSAQFVSPGNGTAYTLNSLSAAAPTVLVNNSADYSMLANITISAGDSLIINENTTLKIGAGLQLTVAGTYLTQTSEFTVTAIDSANSFKGILFDQNSFAELKNTTFEHGGGIRASTGNFQMDSCVVRYFKSGLVTGSAISFSTGNPVVKNSKFIENDLPAVSSGANQSVALLFENNYLYGNTKLNSNRPQINMGPSGSATTIIKGNTIIGDRSLTKVGGVSVSSLLGVENHFIIEENIIKDNRYGFTCNGAGAGEIKNNLFEYNDTETTPNNGGSGISLYNTGLVKITGNEIRNSLWGVTLIGTAQANLGTEEEYGNNIFKDNGNGGVLYALYNNTANPVNAVGNCWREGEISTAEMVAEVIWDSADFSTLGTVNYSPFLCGETMAVNDTKTQKASIYPNPNNGNFVLETEQSGHYIISDLSGKRIVSGNITKGKNQISHTLSSGMYIMTIQNGAKKTSEKIIVK